MDRTGTVWIALGLALAPMFVFAETHRLPRPLARLLAPGADDAPQ